MSDPELKCVIIGGGGHAKVLLDSLFGAHPDAVCVIVDSDEALWGKSLQGVPIVGSDAKLPALKAQGMHRFVVGLGSVGDPAKRIECFNYALSCALIPFTVKHPSAICSPSVEIGAGSVLFPGCVVNAGAVIGKNTIINSGAVIEHDCRIGDHAHVAPRACLCGTVSVGTGAHIGAGATVKQGIDIGESALVGAGALVVKDLPPGQQIMGALESASQRAGRNRAAAGLQA